MVNIGMVYDIARAEEKMIISEALSRDIRMEILKLDEIAFELDSERNFEDTVFLQRSISYFRSLYSTKILEEKGARVVNNFDTILNVGNKIFTTCLLRRHGIPTPRTFVSFNKESAMKSLEDLGYPAVIKPVIGSWGRMVAPLNDVESAAAMLEMRQMMHPIYQTYYLQTRVKRPPRDIRAFVIGNQFVTAIYRYAPPGDWRTNTALSGKAEPCPNTSELVELSLKATEVLGADYLGIDFMESEDGLLVHEANATTEFRNTVKVTGANIAGILIDYLISISKR